MTPANAHRAHDTEKAFRPAPKFRYLALGVAIATVTTTRFADAAADKDSTKVWWTEGGVHQNFAFPVQPDPVSGMHCWHQKVTVEKAHPGDRYGDVFADTGKSMAVYREWKALARPAPGPGGLRRPLHFKRVVRPAEQTYRLE